MTTTYGHVILCHYAQKLQTALSVERQPYNTLSMAVMLVSNIVPCSCKLHVGGLQTIFRFKDEHVDEKFSARVDD